MVERREEWVAAAPASPLRPYIERYCGYRLTGFPPAMHRGLPSRHMTFIVSIGDDIDVVAQTDPAQPPQHYGCVLSGLQASSALISHSGDQEGVAVELTPLGSRALFGMPAGELWNVSVELVDVVGAVGRELWERLQGTAGWGDRFAVCDAVLGRLAGDGAPAPELRFAWERVVASSGGVSVRDLAEESGWSRQHLARRFRSEFGLSPKLAARVVRFERAQHMLRRSPPFVSIAQVAAACGYYDQAHLTRDFAALAGCTPTELLAGDVPSVQDSPHGAEASSSHERNHHDNDNYRLAVPHLP
ncbi:helix-turn-helix transcriptional regulator [Streptomyces sp. NBC_00287]|uniref:helix-turn-helix domain-containing protein n=1 Tax=Streptomyces sp. NBC_00287 TaxID=2975702 RepID=UPI002E2CB303|nr:helix-turn-helix domain-containing protein [Streptomyces sp. NBC_00287]